MRCGKLRDYIHITKIQKYLTRPTIYLVIYILNYIKVTRSDVDLQVRTNKSVWVMESINIELKCTWNQIYKDITRILQGHFHWTSGCSGQPIYHDAYQSEIQYGSVRIKSQTHLNNSHENLKSSGSDRIRAPPRPLETGYALGQCRRITNQQTTLSILVG